MFELNKEQVGPMRNALALAGSNDRNVALKAQAELAQGVSMPLRQTILAGDIIGQFFKPVNYVGQRYVEYMLDIIAPGQQNDFRAYVMPQEGAVPEARVHADTIMIPTFQIANAIDGRLKLLRDANWPIFQRMVEIFEAGFIKKMNDDGWQTIIGAGVDRNIIVNDTNAANGQFTPRLISLLTTTMRRNGGGNATSTNRSRLTDLIVSPEAQMDIRSWGLDLIPDAARTNIYYSDPTNPDLMKVYGVNILAMDEFGEGQEYQDYYTNNLDGTMATGDTEIVIGLDRTRDDSFFMPYKEELTMYEDPNMHRRQLFGFYGWMELGFAVLDSRRVLVGSM